MPTVRHLLRHAAVRLLTPFASLLLLAASSATGSPGGNAPIVVTTTSDTPAAGQTTLREAIALANSQAGPDEITFDPTIFAAHQTIVLHAVELPISTALTITGPAAGVTVSGNHRSRVFMVNLPDNNTTASLSGVTVTGGEGSGSVLNGSGGGIFLYHGNLNLTGCTIAENSATTEIFDGSGGGIFAPYGSGTLTITNCSITGNTSNRSGGGIASTSTLVMTGCTVADNTSNGQIRGVAGGVEGNGLTTLTNCTIVGNRVLGSQNGSAGGLFVQAGPENASGGISRIIHCTITGNAAAGTLSAGGVRLDRDNLGSVVLVNTIVAGNTGTNGATADLNDTASGTGFTSGGSNLIGDASGATGFTQNVNGDQAGTAALPLDPRLGALGNHGGPTQTVPLLWDSPAIDRAKAVGGVTTDQRGAARTVDLPDSLFPNAGGDGTDIGAYELTNAPIVVTSASDTPAAGVLTLRQAIALAESQPGDDTIVFNVPGARVHTILVGSALPTITQPLVIDGYSQPGAKANTLAVGSDAVLLIELQRSAIASFNGLNLTGSGSTIRGLAIGGFERGIGLDAASGNAISGNWIGVHADGETGFSNNFGVVLSNATNNTIGGTRPADRNVISGQTTTGIYLGVGADADVIQGNYIGANAAGSGPFPNEFCGIHLTGATNITIGGIAAGAGNVISSNTYDGILMENGAGGVVVQGNRIGTDATGASGLANEYGIVTLGASGNTIGGTAPGAGNIIAHNQRDGVYIGEQGINNALRGNSISWNGVRGLNLGLNLASPGDNGTEVTPNDDGDADIGANSLQNFPIITSVTVNGGDLVINGTLNSTADTAFALDFFVNAAAYREGTIYLGSGAVSTVGNNGTFTVTLPGVTIPEETYVTATATDPTGNTSEFSAPVAYFTGTIQTGPNFVVNTTADSNGLPTTTECSLREAIAAANNVSGMCGITFDPNVFSTARTITLTRGELQLTHDLLITGPAAGVTVDGNHAPQSSVLTIPQGAHAVVTVTGLTITGGTNSGIFVFAEGSLRLTNCTVSQNSGVAGGILSVGELILETCTISGNTADNGGGGIYNGGRIYIYHSTITGNIAHRLGGGGINSAGDAYISQSTIANNTSQQAGGGGIHAAGNLLDLINSTLSGNHADFSSGDNGGGLWTSDCSVTLQSCTITANTAAGTNGAGGVRASVATSGAPIYAGNTIIAGNRGAGGATADLNNTAGGVFGSSGYNLIGDGTGATGFAAGTLHDQVGTTANPIDARLGPLANHGGLTQTHALLTAPIVSPAIDAGNSGLDTDQRGFARGFDNPAASNGSGNLSDIGAVEQDSTVTPVLQTGPNFVVNTTEDTDDLPTTTNCSLREAINAAGSLAPGTATITFDPTVFATAQTITLGGSDLVIQHAMTIVGPGADKLTISGNNQSRIFTVNTADGLNTISGLTVTGGNGSSNVLAVFGGGIGSVGDLLLVDCTITGNSALRGGGVQTYGTLTMRGCTISNNTALDSGGGGVDSSLSGSMTNCTISGNHADRAGGGGNAGGVWNARGAMTISNCTITGNTAAGTKGSGGVRSGAFDGAGSITVSNSIIAGNTGTGGATADVSDASGATTISEGFNLIGDGAGSASFVNGTNGDQVGTTANPLDPRLGPLANNGGPTPTHALLAFSPAIDKGKAFGGVTTDQRGLTRPIDLPNADYPNAAGGDGSDIGALEAQVEPPLPPYAGVDDAVAGTTHGVTRIYPLANDVSPSGRPLSLLSVSNPAILIYGRSLIIPAGFTGSFTYTFTDGTTIGSAKVTVTAGTPVLNARTFSGLLLDPHGAISGAVDATFTATGRAASVRMTAGARVSRFWLYFPAGSNVGSRFLGFGTLTLTRNADGTVSASFASAGDLVAGILQPRKAAAPAGRYNAALASIDAAIPGGGYLFVNTLGTSGAFLIGRLPDGAIFSASTSTRDDGTIAFHAIIRRRVNPPDLVGGELVFSDLLATDLAGELAWAKPVQKPGVTGLHLGGVNTILTVNGCQFKKQPLPAGSGMLSLSGGDLAADEDTAVTVTAGRPTVPTGSLKSWVMYPRYGIFRARVKVPGLPLPVPGAGVYLPKSNSAWGFFPGTDVGGRIELETQ